MGCVSRLGQRAARSRACARTPRRGLRSAVGTRRTVRARLVVPQAAQLAEADAAARAARLSTLRVADDSDW
jgi:hypothetical protein